MNPRERWSANPVEGFTANPVIEVEGTSNFRSVAGYVSRNGLIREGSLFRSDALDVMTPKGAEQFQEHGISRIIDLRRAEETRRAPNALPQGLVEAVNHSLFAGAELLDGTSVPSIRDIYQAIVRDRALQLTQAASLIADAPDGGVLVHCTAGKDRTGMVIATVLEAVGVPRAQVVADYESSASNLAGAGVERMVRAYRRRNGVVPDETSLTLISTSPGDALEAALETIDRTWGGTEAMFLEHGMGEGALSALRERLTDRANAALPRER